MEVITAKTGFCVGIVHAYRKMNETAGAADTPLVAIHDSPIGPWDTLRRIDRKDPELLRLYPNLASVSVKYETNDLQTGDRVMLGFHGLPKEARQELADRGVVIAKNLHCPFIATLDRTVDQLAAAGYDLFIVGQKGTHHVVDAQRFAARHGRTCGVIETVEDVDRQVPLQATGAQLALVGQVTGNTELWDAVVNKIKTENRPVKIVNTVCSDSYDRQHEARDIASRVDVVVLVPGLAAVAVEQVVSRVNSRVHSVSSKEDVQLEWFHDAKAVGVLGGITVPQWTIDEVAAHIEHITRQPHVARSGDDGCGESSKPDSAPG
jgi:4-hydroxy-3-methylbut-2-enyl diphosphate reductase